MLHQHNVKILALIAGFVLMALLSAFSMSFAQGDTWTTKAPMLVGKEGCASCVLDGKIYVMGGKADCNSTATKTVAIFDPQANTWTEGIELPISIYDDASASVVNDKIYVIGSSLQEFDPVTQSWKLKTPMPTQRSGFTTCVVDNKIYAIGGYGSTIDPLQTVEVYDPMTNTWARKKDMPTPRGYHAAVMAHRKIYVMGGGRFLTAPLQAVEEYDPLTDTWTRKKDMPTARLGLAAESWNGMIYAMGGATSVYSATILAVNEEYDPLTDKWFKRAALPTPRCAFAIGVVQNKIYVIGGIPYVNPDGTYPILTSVEEYVVSSAPYVIYQRYNVDDSEGNNNANPDPGETVKLIVTLSNIRFDAVNVSATLRSHDPDVQITQATANFGDIPRLDISTNQNNPFVLSITSSCLAHSSKFYLDISGAGGYATIDSFQMVVGTPDFLLVDDDGGANYEDYYTKYFLQAKWNVSSRGCPTQSVAQAYKAIIWFTGDERENTLTSDEQAFLASYLDNGGRLFLTGQNIGYDLIQTGTSSDSAFYTNYLHAQYISDSTNVTTLKGVAGDPITKGYSYQFTGDYGAGNQTAPDVISPIVPAVTIFNYRPSVTGAALRYEDKYRLVYFAFGFEGIAGPSVDSAEKLMTNILTWLQGTTAVHQVADSKLPEDFILEQNYPNPFNPTTTISYALAKDSHVKLTVYNTLGQVVAVLVNGVQAQGSYSVTWDAQNQPSGLYIYRLEADGFTAARKMFLQK